MSTGSSCHYRNEFGASWASSYNYHDNIACCSSATSTNAGWVPAPRTTGPWPLSTCYAENFAGCVGGWGDCTETDGSAATYLGNHTAMNTPGYNGACLTLVRTWDSSANKWDYDPSSNTNDFWYYAYRSSDYADYNDWLNNDPTQECTKTYDYDCVCWNGMLYTLNHYISDGDTETGTLTWVNNIFENTANNSSITNWVTPEGGDPDYGCCACHGWDRRVYNTYPYTPWVVEACCNGSVIPMTASSSPSPPTRLRPSLRPLPPRSRPKHPTTPGCPPADPDCPADADCCGPKDHPCPPPKACHCGMIDTRVNIFCCGLRGSTYGGVMTGPGPIRTHNFYIEPTNHLSAGGGTQKLENFGATSSCLPGNSSNYCTYIPFCGASSSSCVQEPERAWLPAQQGNDLLDAIFQCKLGGYQYEGVGVRTGAVLTAPSLSTGAANEPALQGVWYNGMFGRGGTTYRPASFTTPTFNLPGFHILHGWCDSIYHPPHWYQISQDWFPKQTYGCYLAQFMGFSSTFFWYELQNLFNEFSHWGCPLTRLKGDAAGTIEALSYDIHFDHREGIGIELGVGHWCDTDYGNLPKPFVFDCFWPGNIYEDRMERPYRNKITTNNQGLLFYHDNKSYFQQRQKWKSRRPVPLSRIKSELSFRELSSLTYSPQVWGNTFGAPNFLTELWNKEDDHAHGHAGLAIEIAPSKMSYGQVIYARALGGSLTCCPGNAKQGNPNIHFRIIADHGVPHVDPVTSSYAFSPNPSSSSYAYGKACYKNIHGDLISTLTTEPGFGERWPSFWAKVDCCEPSESFASPTPIPSPSACSYNSSLSNIVYVTGSNPGLSLKSWNLAISTFSVDKIPPSTHWSSVPDPNLTETTFLHGLENLPITHLDQMNYMSIPIWGDGKFIYTARQKNSEALPGAVEKGLTTWVANGCGGLIKCGEALGGDTCTDIWGDGNFVYTLNSWNWLWYDGEKIWEYGPGGYNLIAQPPTHGVHTAMGLHSYAISNEGQPTHKDWHFPWSNTFMTAWGMAHSLRDPMRPNRIWGDGSFVYMSDMCMGTPDGPHQSCPRVGGLHTYSVDGLGNLTHVTVKSLAHFAHGIWGDGNFIYVATAMGTGYPITYSGGLYVFSVDSSGNLTQLDFNSVEPCFDVWGDGDFIYTVGYGGLINSYSVDSSGILTHIDSKSTGIVRVGYQDTGVRIHGDGNLIYATYRTAGLHVYGCIKTGPNAGHLVHLDDAFTPHPYYGTAFGVFAYPAGGNP